jgi:putative ABC transport system permease protein
VVGVVEDVSITRVAALADIWVPISTTKSRELLDQLMGDHFGIYLAATRGDIPRIKAEFRSRLEHIEFTDPERFHTLRGVPMTRFEALASGGRIDDTGEPIKEEILTIVVGVLAFLLLPIINLISINVSRILERASEIGVRKAFGASSLHLVGQFVFENIILCLLGGAVALVAAAGVLELINASGVIPHAAFRLNARVFVHALLLSVLFGLLSGAYPAWRMSRLHPVQALRGGTR